MFAGVQQSASLDEPPLTDLRTVREVAHITEHAAIAHGLLGSIVGLIEGVRTGQSKDVSQHWPGQFARQIAAGASQWAGRVGRRCLGRVPRTAPGTGPKLVEKAHPGEVRGEMGIG